jgi:hypothetical protein
LSQFETGDVVKSKRLKPAIGRRWRKTPDWCLKKTTL